MSIGSEQVFQGRYGTYKIRVERSEKEDGFRVSINGRTVNVEIVKDKDRPSKNVLVVDGRVFNVEIIENTASSIALKVDGELVRLHKGEAKGPPTATERRSDPSTIRAQIPGKVISVLVKPGSSISKGDTVVVIESMKMQTRVKADREGRVKEVRVKEGSAVSPGDPLVVLEQS